MNRHQARDDGLPDLSALAAPRTPERDLWSGIEPRLRPRRRRSSWRYALAASLVAGLAMTVWMQPRPLRPDAVPMASLSGRLPMPADSRAIVEAHLQMLEFSEQQIAAALASGGDADALQRLQHSNRVRQQQLLALLAREAGANAGRV